MLKEEFEKLAGYEVSMDDYTKIIEPMYLATDLSKEDFIKSISGSNFALKTKEELIEAMRSQACLLKDSCTHYIDFETKEKLDKLFEEYKERFDSSAHMEDEMIWSCYYPSKITSSHTNEIIYLQRKSFFTEVKTIEGPENKYIYFEIKTEYSEESYFAQAKYESMEICADDFLSMICFCDAYEITLTRYATADEAAQIDEFLKLDVVPEGFGDVGEEMDLLEAQRCYFEQQEATRRKGKTR